MNNIQTIWQDFCAGNTDAGLDLCRESESVHAAEEFVAAWDANDWDSMVCAVRQAIRVMEG